MNKCAIILAAGQGTRIKSKLPKFYTKLVEKKWLIMLLML